MQSIAFLKDIQMRDMEKATRLMIMVRYGGNKESSKVQRTLLKQQYENFAKSSSKTLDQTFDKLQKLISQLEIQGEVNEQEDMNLKLLRSVSSEWKTHALIWKSKEDIETISLDDLYNNLKTYEPELTGSSSISQNPQNVAFVSSNSTNNTSNTNEVDNTAFRVGTVHSQAIIKMDTLQENIELQGIKKTKEESMSYQAEEDHPTNYALMALTSSRSSSSSDSEVDSCFGTCIKAYATLKEQYDSLSSDSKKSQFNLVSYKAGLQYVEERLAHYKKNEVVFEEKINILNLKVKLRDNALVENTKKLEKVEKERDELKLTLEKFQNSAKSLNNLLENQVSNKVKTRLGYKAASPAVESFVNSSKMLENQENVKSIFDKGYYHAVSPPYTGNYIPHKPDLMFVDKQVESESVDVVSNIASSDVKTVESKHEYVDLKNKSKNPSSRRACMYNTVEIKPLRKNSFSPPIIEDWNSDDERKVEIEPKVEVKTVRPSIKMIKFVKTVREK
nr:hypothetical protein [Tanacetum cinerariifolium]